MPNINDHFFEGYYKEIWKALIPEDLTVKEVDFMVDYFNLQKDSTVLDIMSGYGRHAIALGRKQISVTAVDNLEAYILEIRDTAEKEQLPVWCVQSDILQYKGGQDFDLAICMGNSLNFFDAGDTQELFRTVSAQLKKGGHLLINSWSLAEIIYKNFKEKSWSRIGDTKFLTDARFLFQPTRIETDSTILFPDGSMETKKGIDYIFSINEMDSMLQKAGFILKDLFSIPGKKKFSLGEPRAYLVAEKQ